MERYVSPLEREQELHLRIGDLSVPESPEGGEPVLPSGAFCSERNGAQQGGFPCSQELAYEIIIREIHDRIREEYALTVAEYNGEAFLLVSEHYSPLVRALCALKASIDKLQTPRVQNINTGTARDLKNVPMSKKIKFLGDGKCVICSLEIESRERVRRTPCMHLFHTQCLTPWLQIRQTCPIDKMPISL